MPDDFPFYEVAIDAQLKMREGFVIHQKFTCARCGSRQTMSEPNLFFVRGTYEECGHETNIEARGCNFVAMIGAPAH